MKIPVSHTSTHPVALASPSDSRRWWALAVIGLAQLMITLDATIMNIALPSAQADLGFTDSNRQWVVTAYTLTFGGLLLLGGRVGDIIGRRRALVIGLIGFAAASTIGGVAVNTAMLLGSRALQGVFAALLTPAALSLLAVTFTEPRERAKAFGIFGAVASGGNAIGLLLGGALTEYLGWHWCLLVNVPISVIAVTGALSLLRRDQRAPAQERRRLDAPGALLVTAGLLSLVFGLGEAEQHGWSSLLVVATLLAGVLLLIVFAVVENHTRHALLPLRIVADRNRGGAFVSAGLIYGGMFAVLLFLSYYLQTVEGWSAVRAGMAFLPLTASMVIGSMVIGTRLIPRFGPRAVMVPGMLIAAAGTAYLTQIEYGSSYPAHLLPSMIGLGLGIGMAVPAALGTATAGVAGPDTGVASASVTMMQQVSGSIGVALLNTVAASVTSSLLTDRAARTAEQLATATVHGFSTAMWISFGALIVAAVSAAALINIRPAIHTAPSADGTAKAGNAPTDSRTV
ncbi:MFS transporter [Streptomyces sp. NPDC090088]|uniref:MFS transporter n=1 Tax=Streptomyces sp. NPDC090088 TaxID=3365944 RepID=UPI00381215E4